MKAIRTTDDSRPDVRTLLLAAAVQLVNGRYAMEDCLYDVSVLFAAGFPGE